MFSHVMVGANYLEASRVFYDALFETLGVKPGRPDRDRYFWRTRTGVFGIAVPIDGQPATHANGGTIGFAVENAEQANAWHAAGLANGGTAIEEPPGIRSDGVSSMYLAYLRDPSGNKICALKFIPKDE